MLLRASRVVVWRLAMSFGAEVGTAVTRAAAARETTTKNFILECFGMSRKERGKRRSPLEGGKNDGIVNRRPLRVFARPRCGRASGAALVSREI